MGRRKYRQIEPKSAITPELKAAIVTIVEEVLKRTPPPDVQEQPEKSENPPVFETVLKGRICLYDYNPRIEYADANNLVISIYQNKRYSICLYQSGKRKAAIETPSRPIGIMKLEDGFAFVYKSGDEVVASCHNEAFEEKSRETYTDIRAISSTARIVCHKNKIYHSDMRDGRLKLLSTKMKWIDGDFLVDSGESVYVISKLRIRRYYSNKNSDDPVWERIPTRSINLVNASDRYLICVSGERMTLYDLEGNAREQSLPSPPACVCSHKSMLYALCDDVVLRVVDMDKNELVEEFHVAEKDVTASLYIACGVLYYTTSVSVHKYQL